MTSYELSISADYVPSWGVVEAIREFFQNALDEETRESNNQMFFNYDPGTEILRIGNRHGKLDAKTLLLGYTEKKDQAEMIGSHGEGYKIATVVLLRLNKQITFYNYGCRQIWKPRFVKSRKYGVMVPTFFVEKKPVWDTIPDNDLVIEIAGITHEEYEKIKESNLHLVGGDYRKFSTEYGDILKDEKYKTQIFVGGLYICSDPDLEFGVDLHPDIVRLERDRTMVNTFDVRWYVARMIEATEDAKLIEQSLAKPSGEYIRYHGAKAAGDTIAQQFLEEYGLDAVPVAGPEDAEFAESTNTIPVSRTMRDFILESDYYKGHFTTDAHDHDSVSGRMMDFANKVKDRLWKSDLATLSQLIKDVKKLEDSINRNSEITED